MNNLAIAIALWAFGGVVAILVGAGLAMRDNVKFNREHKCYTCGGELDACFYWIDVPGKLQKQTQCSICWVGEPCKVVKGEFCQYLHETDCTQCPVYLEKEAKNA